MDLAKRFYDDSLTHSGRTLHFLVEMVGCSPILLGSDHPFDMRDRDPVNGVNSSVGPTQEDIDGMLGGNAAGLLKLSWEEPNPMTFLSGRPRRSCQLGAMGPASDTCGNPHWCR
jgi:hypothetical protein